MTSSISPVITRPLSCSILFWLLYPDSKMLPNLYSTVLDPDQFISDAIKNSSAAVIGIELEEFCSISHIFLVIFGVPLNLTIVIVMLTNRELKNKPKNVLLLGASLSGLFALLTIVIELVAYHYQNSFLCKVFCWSSAVGTTCFMYNLLLALLARFLAIVCPLLHQSIVTAKKVRIVQATGVTIIFLLIKGPYLFGVTRLQCNAHPMMEAKSIAVINFILIISCIILNIVVYIKTKEFAQPDRVIVTVSLVNKKPSNLLGDEDEEPIKPADGDDGAAASTSIGTVLNQNNSLLQVHGRNLRLKV